MLILQFNLFDPITEMSLTISCPPQLGREQCFRGAAGNVLLSWQADKPVYTWESATDEIDPFIGPLKLLLFHLEVRASLAVLAPDSYLSGLIPGLPPFNINVRQESDAVNIVSFTLAQVPSTISAGELLRQINGVRQQLFPG